VFAVRDAARKAVDRARSGDGPCFIEALTYRFVGHSRSDPGKYRKPGELDEWKERDPLIRARSVLGEHVDAGELERLEASVETQIEELAEKALAAPYPAPDDSAREFAGG